MHLKPTYRVLFVIVAFVVALLVVYLLTVAGGKTRGPLRNTLHQAEQNLLDIENDLIIKKRMDRRRKNLASYDSLYSGKKSLCAPRFILFGASDNTRPESFESIIRLEDSLGMTFQIISIYAAWGSKPEQQFPEAAARTIVSLGSSPFITWEPWLNDFDEAQIPGLPPADKRDKGGLRDIASGLYHSYVKAWAERAKEIKKPFFLRFGHEMNDPYRYPWGPQNNRPEDYVKAWRYIHDVFDSVGVDNAIWVWSPHLSYPYIDAFYPGDEYVDYIGVGVLNFGTAATWSKWWTFMDLFGSNYGKIKRYNKPIMLTEYGSLVTGGDRGHWFADGLRMIPSRFPLIKAVVFFHQPKDQTITDKVVSWYFVDDSPTLDSIQSALATWPDSLKALH